MDTFGRYRLSFEPSEDDMTPTVEMTISGEADLYQMTSFFDSFLKANGYLYDGELRIVPKGKGYEEDLWKAYSYDEYKSQATDFVPFSLATDVINWGLK